HASHSIPVDGGPTPAHPAHRDSIISADQRTQRPLKRIKCTTITTVVSVIRQNYGAKSWLALGSTRDCGEKSANACGGAQAFQHISIATGTGRSLQPKS